MSASANISHNAGTQLGTAWPNETYRNPRGFENPGNLCYRNAALILLLHIPELWNWLRCSYQPSHDRENCGFPDDCLGCRLCRLYEVYWLESPRDLEPCLELLWLHIQNAAWKGRDIREQHDMCEFLDALIARLHADSTENARVDLESIFQSIIAREGQCSQCGQRRSLPRSMNWWLIASFPEDLCPGSHGLLKTIENNLRPTSLQVACRGCGGSRIKHEIRQEIVLYPEVFFVQINRFQHDKQKNQDYVCIEETLTFPPEMIQYRLYAFVNHLGRSIDHGHYNCFVQGPYGDWAGFNDGTVSAKTLADLRSYEKNRKDVYVLAYRRTQSSPLRSTLPLTPDCEEEGPSIEQPPCAVTLDEIIMFKGRAVRWTFKQQLAPPGDSRALIKLKSARARVQRAHIRIKLTSTTGEVLEGEGIIPLQPNIIPAQPVSKTARPRGVLKKKLPKPKIPPGHRPFTRSAAKLLQQSRGVAG